MINKRDFMCNINVKLSFTDLRKLLQKQVGREVTDDEVAKYRAFLENMFYDNVMEHIDGELDYLAGEFIED